MTASEKPWTPEKTPWSIIRAALIVASDVRRKYDLGYVEYEAMSALLDEIARQADDQIAALAAVQCAEKDADTKRMEHLEDWLDGFEFVERGDIQRHVRCDWFVGDGGGHWFTEGKTFREAVDKSLNHEATRSDDDPIHIEPPTQQEAK